VIGINRGVRVIVTHASRSCRDGPQFMIRYDVAPGRACAAAGGVTRQIGFLLTHYCEPALLARKQEATRQAGWVCGFQDPGYAPALPRPRAGEECPAYYARIFRETR
jgi:hypothetical protein